MFLGTSEKLMQRIFNKFCHSEQGKQKQWQAHLSICKMFIQIPSKNNSCKERKDSPDFVVTEASKLQGTTSHRIHPFE